MPNNDQSLTADITAGESLMVQEASKEPSPGAVEDTTPLKRNEEQVAVKPQTASLNDDAVSVDDKKDGSETFVSGSSKARQLGESRRKLAEGLLKLAKGDIDKGIPGRSEEVKKIIEGDVQLDKYFKKAWPKEYSVMFGGITETDYDENLKAIEEQATIKAKAEVLAEQLKIERREEAFDLALQLKFTQAEADTLYELADKLDGTSIAGKPIDYDEALKRAAHVVRPDKAKVGITSIGQVTQPPSETVIKQAEDDAVLVHYAKRTGKNLDEVKRTLKEVVEPNLKGNVFQFPM